MSASTCFANGLAAQVRLRLALDFRSGAAENYKAHGMNYSHILALALALQVPLRLAWLAIAIVIARAVGIACHFIDDCQTPLHSTVWHGTARRGTARQGTARHGTARHDTTQHRTARHAAPRHGTARHAVPRHSTGSANVKFIVTITVYVNATLNPHPQRHNQHQRQRHRHRHRYYRRCTMNYTEVPAPCPPTNASHTCARVRSDTIRIDKASGSGDEDSKVTQLARGLEPQQVSADSPECLFDWPRVGARTRGSPGRGGGATWWGCRPSTRGSPKSKVILRKAHLPEPSA